MQRILITGANSGIGRATALHLAGKGYTVYAAMRDLAKAKKLLELAASAGAEVHPVRLDVNDDASVREAVAEIQGSGGPVDVMINNAGIAFNAAVEDVDIDQGRAVFETNYWGIIRCVSGCAAPGCESRVRATL